MYILANVSHKQKDHKAVTGKHAVILFVTAVNEYFQIIRGFRKTVKSEY